MFDRWKEWAISIRSIWGAPFLVSRRSPQDTSFMRLRPHGSRSDRNSPLPPCSIAGKSGLFRSDLFGERHSWSHDVPHRIRPSCAYERTASVQIEIAHYRHVRSLERVGYFDQIYLGSAILGLTTFPTGYVLHALTNARPPYRSK